MSYLGYRITIGETNITNDLIQKGSWKYVPKKKIVKQWEDADKKIHQDILGTRRAEITFSLRVRTLADQETLAPIFQSQENLICTYWDDVSCTYKTGTFFMDEPQFNHLHTATGDILYDATQIHLTEY